MRKITKSLLTLALLVLAVGGANATKLYATYGSPAGEGSWNAGTNTYSWTKNYSNLMPIFTFSNGELANYTSIKFSTTSYTDVYRLYFHGPNKEIAFYSAGDKTIVFAEREEFKGVDLSTVTGISFGGASGSGSIIISNKPYLEKPMSLTWNDDGTADIDLSDLTASDGFTFNDQTGELTGTGSSGVLSVNFPAGGVDLSSLTGFSVTYTGDNLFGGFKIGINETTKKDFYSNPTGRNDLAQYMTAGEVGDPSAITLWKWWNNSTAGTMTISSIKLKANVISANPGGMRAIESLSKKYYEGGEWKTGSVSTSYGTGIGTAMGDGNATQDEYADIAAYKEIRLYVSSGDPRLFLVKASSFVPTEDGYILTKDGVKQNGQWNGIQDTDHKLVKNGDYYYITVADIKAACGGEAKLIGVKAEYGQTINISKIVVMEDSEYNYLLSGSGSFSSSVITALADANATCYDATGVTGSGVDFTSVANPNALFVAGSGVLANTKNVIVSGTCANLVLEDGHPFKAPADFTATSASYTTTINTTAKAGTLCLPFAATIPGEVTAWTLTYTSGDKATAAPVATTIPANTPVLLNGSGSKTFSGSGAVSASATNVSGALTGVFAAATVPVNSYVLQYQDPKVGFFKVTGDKTINSFRAYLTAETPAPGLSIIFPEDSDVTGISEIEKMKNADNVTIFDLQGRKVAQPQKGLYIVNGKKVIFK